jgi:hypothetical protein
MQTVVFEVKLTDGRIFRVFCEGKNQIKRFKNKVYKMENLDSFKAITTGIHTIAKFEKIV